MEDTVKVSLMEEKSKKLIKGTMASIIANVIVYIVSTVALIVVSNIAKGMNLDVVDLVTFILFVVVWPLINLILSIKALASRNKPPVGYKGVAVTNLVLSIAGPVLYGLTCLLNLLDPGV